VSFAPAPLTDQGPRYGTPRRGDRPSRGGLLREVAGLIGWRLHPWQAHAADVALEYDSSSRQWLYRTVGVSVARQNGKTTLVCARVAMQLIMPRQTIAYTAQDRNIARFKWAEHVAILMGTPFAQRVQRVSRINGAEALLMDNGSQYVIVTPGEGAGRSMSLDLAVIDEAWAHRDLTLVGALAPTMAARPHAQLWILSNAGTFESGLWRHYTDTGRAQTANPLASLCWLEWAAADDCDVLDHTGWRAANPSLDLPHGVTTPALSDAALTLDADTFRREHLNQWVDVSGAIGIDPQTWDACRDDDLVPAGRVVLALDYTPERDRAALVAAGMVDGRTPLEVIDHTADLERAVQRTIDTARRWTAPVLIERGGPAASSVPALEQAGVTVRVVSLPDFVRACGDFHDAALTRQLSHRGDYRLTDAIAAASKRTVGDAWAWRRRGGSDIAPLVAATLARWGIVTETVAVDPVIY
jgi:hypothetical protein